MPRKDVPTSRPHKFICFIHFNRRLAKANTDPKNRRSDSTPYVLSRVTLSFLHEKQPAPHATAARTIIAGHSTGCRVPEA